MAEVTYFVALPFTASEDGVAAGEPTECLDPNAAVVHAEALARIAGENELRTLSSFALRNLTFALPDSVRTRFHCCSGCD
jgi:hypothetical protein